MIPIPPDNEVRIVETNEVIINSTITEGYQQGFIVKQICVLSDEKVILLFERKTYEDDKED